MFIYLSITKYASHLDLDPYKMMSSKQMSRSMSKSTFTYLFMILKSIIKYASHLDQFKMMSSNVAKWCHQMLHCCIVTTVVLEPAICEDLDLHIAIFVIAIDNMLCSTKFPMWIICCKCRFHIQISSEIFIHWVKRLLQWCAPLWSTSILCETLLLNLLSHKNYLMNLHEL